MMESSSLISTAVLSFVDLNWSVELCRFALRGWIRKTKKKKNMKAEKKKIENNLEQAIYAVVGMWFLVS